MSSPDDFDPPPDVIEAWARDCRCCPWCSECPCPGCCAGGICDAVPCGCDYDRDNDSDPGEDGE
jgi:hypothetical protein